MSSMRRFKRTINQWVIINHGSATFAKKCICKTGMASEGYIQFSKIRSERYNMCPVFNLQLQILHLRKCTKTWPGTGCFHLAVHQLPPTCQGFEETKIVVDDGQTSAISILTILGINTWVQPNSINVILVVLQYCYPRFLLIKNPTPLGIIIIISVIG